MHSNARAPHFQNSCRLGLQCTLHTLVLLPLNKYTISCSNPAVLLCRLGDSQQKQQGGSPPEVEMVVLRFSLELRSPGCMHFVLESVSPKPPYLIENRTAHPFRYRQSLRQGGGLDTIFIDLLA